MSFLRFMWEIYVGERHKTLKLIKVIFKGTLQFIN